MEYFESREILDDIERMEYITLTNLKRAEKYFSVGLISEDTKNKISEYEKTYLEKYKNSLMQQCKRLESAYK